MVENSAITSTITTRATVLADIDTSCWTVDRDCLGNNNIPARTTSC